MADHPAPGRAYRDVLHKDVLSQADILVSMKLTASQDRAAIGRWIEGQADREPPANPGRFSLAIVAIRDAISGLVGRIDFFASFESALRSSAGSTRIVAMSTPTSLKEVYTDKIKDLWSANDQIVEALRTLS